MKAIGRVWVLAILGLMAGLASGAAAAPEVEVEICPRCGEPVPEGGCPMAEEGCPMQPPAKTKTETRTEMRVWPVPGGEGKARIFINGREVFLGRVLPMAPGAWGWSTHFVGAGYLGVGVEPLSEEAAKKAGAPGGALVVRVEEGGPAEKAGLEPGDVISAVGNKGVNTPADLVALVSELPPGSHVAIAYWRDGKERRAGVTVGKRPWGREWPEGGWPEGEWFRELFKPPAKPEKVPPAEKPEEPKEPEAADEKATAFFGIVAAPLGDDMKQIAGTDKGVLVNTLLDDSPAAKAGLLAGDVITEVDGQEVADPGAFVDLVRGRKPGDQVRVTYYRMGRRGRATVALGRRPEDLEGPPEAWKLPEGLERRVPELRKYLDRLRPDLEDWQRRLREWSERDRAAPEPPGPPPEAPEPYRIGKDVGRILERLEAIERRLERIEERLQRPHDR